MGLHTTRDTPPTRDTAAIFLALCPPLVIPVLRNEQQPYLRASNPRTVCNDIIHHNCRSVHEEVSTIVQTQEEAVPHRTRSPRPFEGHYVCQSLPLAFRG